VGALRTWHDRWLILVPLLFLCGYAYSSLLPQLEAQCDPPDTQNRCCSYYADYHCIGQAVNSPNSRLAVFGSPSCLSIIMIAR
jgi:hypothetical protein